MIRSARVQKCFVIRLEHVLLKKESHSLPLHRYDIGKALTHNKVSREQEHLSKQRYSVVSANNRKSTAIMRHSRLMQAVLSNFYFDVVLRKRIKFVKRIKNELRDFINLIILLVFH